MKHGDIIYRVIKNKSDKKWYYCIYEVIKYRYVSASANTVYIEAAPIITYYNSRYSSHITLCFHASEDWESKWRTSWDFISKNEFAAKEAYKQKIEDENQSNNENEATAIN